VLETLPRTLPFGTLAAIPGLSALESQLLEPTLMVIGLNHRTAPVAVRERFWISENRRSEALSRLVLAEGVEEIIVLATCNRTEFLVWANDPSLAANSVLRFLSAEYGLKLCEWRHFYRLLDDAALIHIFRVASSLDSLVLGEPQIVEQVKAAWQLAQNAGSAGRFLDAVMQKALAVSKRVRSETAIADTAASIPSAAVELARQALGTLQGKSVLLLGAGKMSELSARCLASQGAKSICVVNRTYEHALELAATLGGTVVRFEDRLRKMPEADIIISSATCPYTILNAEDAGLIMKGRPSRPLVIVDIAMPRSIDPAVRDIAQIFLYDLDNLEKLIQQNSRGGEAAAIVGRRLVEEEACGFRCRLLAERVVPTIIALRSRLDEICRQELESFKEECGPFSKDEDALLSDVTGRITRKIAGSLARELKDLPEKGEQERMTVAVQRLFHLETPETATAGANSEFSPTPH
jgi:glutamyl-tRNA reductase